LTTAATGFGEVITGLATTAAAAATTGVSLSRKDRLKPEISPVIGSTLKP
jgi:hypothetical protein